MYYKLFIHPTVTATLLLLYLLALMAIGWLAHARLDWPQVAVQASEDNTPSPTLKEKAIVFDDQFVNLDQWQVNRGSEEFWQAQEYKAVAHVTQGFSVTELVPKDEFWDWEWRDLIYEFEYTPRSGADRNLGFNVQDASNWYEVHFAGGSYHVLRVKNGKVVWMEKGPGSLAIDVKHRIRLVLDEQTIQLWVNNQKRIDTVDPTWDEHGPGFGKVSLKATTGVVSGIRVEFENVVVTLLSTPEEVEEETDEDNPGDSEGEESDPEEQPDSNSDEGESGSKDDSDSEDESRLEAESNPEGLLESESSDENTGQIDSQNHGRRNQQSTTVPHFRQTDQAWANNEYNRAQLWAQDPSIRRWGCALVSLAMMLRAHGFDHLPNGQVLDPASLNLWLTNQPDGYVGQGLVNWLAATRLSRELSQKHGLPALEYSRVEGTSLDTARQEIHQGRPVILHILGHFMVADRVLDDDLLIKDPLYEYEQFSKHQTPLLSTRLFHPTFTNLSYLLTVSSPGLEIEVLDSESRQVPIKFFHELILEGATDQELLGSSSSPASQVGELKQPSTGLYNLNISQPELANYQLEIYAYDKDGRVKAFKHHGRVGPEQQTVTINYHQEEVQKTSIDHQLQSVFNVAGWQAMLNWWKKAGYFKKEYVYQALTMINGQLERSGVDGSSVLLAYFDWYRSALDEEIWQQLPAISSWLGATGEGSTNKHEVSKQEINDEATEHDD